MDGSVNGGIHQEAEQGDDMEPGGYTIYRNEFAMVEVGRYETQSGPRLHIRDLSSGSEVFLDPLELEGLTRCRHEHFAPLIDPSGMVGADEPDPDQV